MKRIYRVTKTALYHLLSSDLHHCVSPVPTIDGYDGHMKFEPSYSEIAKEDRMKNTLPFILLAASAVEIFFQNFSVGFVAARLLGQSE